jgi:hypothetical protein
MKGDPPLRTPIQAEPPLKASKRIKTDRTPYITPPKCRKYIDFTDRLLAMCARSHVIGNRSWIKEHERGGISYIIRFC